MVTLGSLFDGICGFPLAFSRAGVATRWVVELDAACRRVSGEHFPEAAAFADVRDVGARNLAPVDIISFGSPCQDLSVAGRRQGLDGERSGLFFEAVRIIRELRPAWALWENVPGALSSNGGRDFGAALDALAGAGAVDLCWRVLDAQWFGVAQRRRRLFLVASFRAGASAAEILFEREGGGGHPPARGEAGEGAPRGAAPGAGGRVWSIQDAREVDKRQNGLGIGGDVMFSLDTASQHAVALALPEVSGPRGGRSGEGGFRQDLDNHGAYIPVAFDERVITSPGNRSRVAPGEPAPTLNGGGLAAVAFHLTQDPILSEAVAPNLSAGNRQGCATVGVAHSIAVRGRQDGQEWELGDPEIGNALRAGDGGSSRGNWALTPQMAVRRLTPLECLRLQGFPDDWLDGLGLADSTKYRMVGNSVAVPVVQWIAERLCRQHRGMFAAAD